MKNSDYKMKYIITTLWSIKKDLNEVIKNEKRWLGLDRKQQVYLGGG